MTNEYPRLFAERFPNKSRPASSGSVEPVDQAAWLANAVGDNDQEEGHWDRVEPVSGALTHQFEDALGSTRR